MSVGGSQLFRCSFTSSCVANSIFTTNIRLQISHKLRILMNGSNRAATWTSFVCTPPKLALMGRAAPRLISSSLVRVNLIERVRAGGRALTLTASAVHRPPAPAALQVVAIATESRGQQRLVRPPAAQIQTGHVATRMTPERRGSAHSSSVCPLSVILPLSLADTQDGASTHNPLRPLC